MKPLTPEIIDFIKKIKMGFVAAVLPDGCPGLSHKGVISVFDDHHLVIADIDSPNILANLRHNRQAVVEVVDYKSRKGYRFRGQVQVFSTIKNGDAFINFYENRERGRMNNFVLIKLEASEKVFSLAYSLCSPEGEVSNWKMYFNNLWKF